jgi:hypothetical protein
MKCKILGCDKKLDDQGFPISYCEWQQGRCPNQKHAFDWNNKFDKFAALVLVPLMLLFVAVVIYVEL